MSRAGDPGGAEYEEFPEPSRGGRWALKLFGLVLVLGLVGAGLAVVAYQRQADPPGRAGADVKVTIPKGASTERISEILASQDVIKSAFSFREVYLRLNGAAAFQAGEYTFKKGQSFDAVVKTLEKGPEITFERLTVPEGLTLPQIAQLVGKLPGRSGDKFLQLAKGGTVKSQFQPPGSTNLEGMLFPDTYFLEPKDDELAILTRMVGALDKAATELGYGRAKATIGLEPYEAIVLSSLVERETRFDDERGKVARAMYNRLERGQLLQIDATVIYALGKSADSNVRVLTKDLAVDSPFNTYKVKGLPPTPIAAPGRESLAAALQPEDGPWLFYVVTETDGRHSFATTNAEHEANIRKAQKNGVR